MNLVFASGFLVPQTIALLPQNIVKGIAYFRDLDDHLTRKQSPHARIFPDVDTLGSVEKRAKQLADQVQAKFPTGPIHIIAHSMGGLDSRALIGNDLNGLAGRIASLTTLSTPHHGSPVADLVVGTKPDDARRQIASALEALGLKKDAIVNLTTTEADKVSDVVRTNPRIRYRSYPAAGRSTPFAPTSLPLLLTYGLIKTIQHEDNDGLVTVKSASYGEVQRVLQCDHADMVGHNLSPFDFFQFPHLDLFDEIISKLEQDGG